MPVYVDRLFRAAPPADPRTARAGAKHGHRWCHMVADTLEELHGAAFLIGLRREWFQPEHGGHYDLTPPRRARAVALGAIELDRRAFIAVVRRNRTAAGGRA